MSLSSLPFWLSETVQPWLGAAALVVPGALAAMVWRYRRLYQEAAAETQNNKELIENLSEGIYRSLPDGRQLSANRALVQLNGYASEAEQLRGVKDIAAEWYVEPGRRAEFQSVLRERGRVENFVSEIYRHKTRERIWITESARLVHHRRTGQPLFYEGSVREITETVERLKLEERFQKLTHQLPGVLFQMELPAGGRARVTYMSPGIARMTGFTHAEHLARAGLFNSLIHADDRAEYYRSVAEAERDRTPWEVEFRIRTKHGEEKWLWMMASPDFAGDMLTWHGYVADISIRKRQEIEIEKLAYFDPLTKLPNRRCFIQRIASHMSRPDAVGALLFIDLDNFKSLNDTRGHDIGDQYLVQVAERLCRAVGAGDMVARIGGDEFVVIAGAGMADNAHALRYAVTVAHRIVATLHEPFDLGMSRHVGSASVGVVAFDGTERRADELLKRADIAMYQAKAAGRNGVALFDPSTMHRETHRYQLLQELRNALAQDRITILLQPQYDDERRLKGAEALVRWQHPTRGLVMPDEFVPLAEQCGIAVELGRHIVEKGLATLASWQGEPRTRDLRLALNIGVKGFCGEHFVPMVREIAERHRVDTGRLTFELTEDIMAEDMEAVVARMKAVKALGIRLALGDFGTGRSSLAYLRHLPFDEIKIDGKFVADIEGSDEGRSLVRTILSMARLLRLGTVAERVGNTRQESFLRAFGCDLFQGDLYSPPLAEPDFLGFLDRHQPGSASEVIEGHAARQAG